MMRLISWNVAGRVRCAPAQLEALEQQEPDIACLLEVRERSLPRLREGLQAAGLSHTLDTLDLTRQLGRRYGELIASRWPLSQLPQIDYDAPCPERTLSSLVLSPWGRIELHCAHIVPGVTWGWHKIEIFEGIYRPLACISSHPRILCGDFNTPHTEWSDGRVRTFGGWDRSSRWDAGERSVLTGLEAFDLTDVYRALRLYERETQDWSWGCRRKRGIVSKRRFHHVFASARHGARFCRYLREPREQGLSDHALVEVCFEPRPWAVASRRAQISSGPAWRPRD